MKRKLFCVWMCIAMIVTLMPSMAFAEDTSLSTEADIDMENEAVASPEVQAASTSNAIAGTIAVTQENEEEELVYEISSEQEEVMRLPYSTDWWFSFGTGDNGTFNAAENISETEIIIEKAGNELGREKLSIEKGFEKSDSIPGIDYGIWYYEGDNDIAEIYCNFRFDLGLDAYKYLTTLAGTYDITVNWVAGGQNYTASTHYTLKRGQAISELSSIEYNEEGFVENIWSNSSNFSDSMIYTYNPLVSYYHSGAEDDGGDTEIVQRYIFTDCAYNGFFNFDRCVTEGLGNVFTKGDTIKYDADTELAPLYIHPRFITEEMVGKSASLIFKNGETEKTVTIKIEKEANTSLVEGRLYVAYSSDVQPASETSDTVRIFCGDSGNDLSDCLKTEIKLSMDERTSRTFVTYQDQALHQVEVENLSETDAELLEMTYSETNGVKKYRLTPLKCGDVNIKALTEDAGTIQCHISLPEIGFYYTPARTGENFIGDEFHYKKATEKKADGTEAYVYLITPTHGYTAEQIKVSCGGWNAETDDWEEKSIDGIAIGTPTVQNLDGVAYAIYKIAISQSYRNPGQNEESFGIVYNNGENIWAKELYIYDSTEISEEEQLYWVYDSSKIEISTDGKISLSGESEDSLDDRADTQIYSDDKSGSMEGYFAVKKAGEYYALQTVQTSETEGISLTKYTDTPYLYKLEWSKFGEYHITATDDKETEYRLNFNVELPNIGFYGTDTRSEGTYIDNEFHYIDAVEKNVDNTEAYFYLIAPTYDYSLNQISVSFGKWLSEEEIEGNVWTEKKISGMEIGTPQMATFDNEKYAVWKITVSDAYRTPYNEWQTLRIIYGSGTNERTIWLRIYDSTEIPEEEQLYWFYDSGDSSEIEIDESGKMSLSSDSERTLDSRAYKQIYWENKSGSTWGYFAVKKDGEYYALRTVQTSETEGISLNEYAGTLYLYKLEWSKFGEYHITATDNGTEYRLNFNAKLPEIGFYSTSSRNEEAYLDEFYYTTASDKNADRTESYFYLIAPTYGYATEQMELSFGKWTWNEETNDQLWSETIITGLSAGSPEIKVFGNEEYAVWKITVSDAYQNPYANRQDLRIAYGKEGMSRTKSIIICDSTEISEEEQLYWFYDSSKIEIDESGKMSLSSDSEGSLDDRAHKQIRWNDKSSSTQGCFAVKKDGEYYALRTAQVAEAEGISLSESTGRQYLYNLAWSEFGEYHITATDNGAEYRLNFNVELPKIGFYSTSNRSEETYLDEFYYADAVEKSKDGKEAYFYCIAPTDGFTKSQIRAFFTEYIRNEETGEGNWEEKSIPGISIAQYETKFFDEKEYVIFQIAVSNQYKDIEMSDKECLRIVYDEGKAWDWGYIKIYDASIVPPSQQLYFFDDYNVTLDSDGKLESRDMDSLSTSARRELFGGNGRSYNGYFAVKEGSEYYAVTPVSVPENVICAKADDDSYSCRITKIGDYEITAAYKGQTYRINAIYSLPSSGFFAKPEKTAENYLYEQFWVQNAIEKSEDGTECYFYLFRDNLDDTESDEIKLMSNSREEGDTAGIKIEVQSKVKKGRITYWIYKITVPITYTAEGNHSESWEMHTDNCRFSIEMFDTGAIRPEQQLHWVYKDDAQIENGKLRPAEGNSTLYPRTEMNLVYNTPWAREGYFAVLKDGEYYPVNNISATDEVTATLDEDSGAFGLVSKHVGEYTITYNDGKQEYYFKSKVVLPTAGCFTSQTYTEEAFIADLFDYNTADENKHFYFIAKENLIKGNSNPDSLQFSITPGDTHDGVGIGVGESGTFEGKGETYYYWEIKVDKSFQHSSDYVQYVVQLKDGNYSLYGNMLKIRGYVKYGDIDKNDKTDFADALWLKRYLADWAHYRTIARREADLDRDGKITASDLMILERHIASWKGYEKLPKVS